ncbi:MAG: hypothetical protein JNK21_13070, partial [Rhodospirillaceae bacterium]|nr:hypothetical protein [Rhodospirillaceae bacterium]
PKLKKQAAKYAGPKGNLKFPYDKPIPYGLIARLVKANLKLNQSKLKQDKPSKKTKTSSKRS